MTTSDRFNILIVDPDTSSRGRLKQVAMSLTTFNKVYVCNNLAEGLEKSKLGEQIDVVVLSYSFGINEVATFVKEAKSSPKGQEWAYVSVLKSASEQHDTIANHVVIGIDGFLFEPYSADNLKEMAEVTAKIKKLNSDKRKLAAMKMLLKEIAKHIDAVSFYKSQKKEVPSATKKLHDACEKLKKYREEYYEIYLEAMIDVFQKMTPPQNNLYTGVSLRVKQKLEQKRLVELETEYQ
jgi:response regulator RpfG family c-di-GMP phosphodiesterase